MAKFFAGYRIEGNKVFDANNVEVDPAKAKRIIAYARIEEIETLASGRNLLPAETAEYITLKIRMGLQG